MTGAIRQIRAARGATAYHAGQSAEDQVARHYERAGLTVCARRWRGAGGEIDLILRQGDSVVFVEVKKAASHAQAAERLGARQAARICASAEAFIGTEPRGALTEMRIDVALVDARGQIEILENALAA